MPIMPIMDQLGREVSGPEGPLRISAMYASLPPEVARPVGGDRGRFFVEVVNPTGNRWHAIVHGDDVTLIEPLEF